MALLVGDFNARVQAAQPGEEGLIGRHTFCREVDALHLQTEEVQDNRSRFIEFLADKTMVAATRFSNTGRKQGHASQQQGTRA